MEQWLARLLDSARASAGFVSGRSALPGIELEPAVAVVFRDEDALHAWLDGDDRRQILADGRALGFWPAAADIVSADGLLPPNGVAGFRHEVADGRAAGHPTMARHFRSMQLLPGGQALEIVNEAGGVYRVDLASRGATQVGGPPASAAAPPQRPPKAAAD